MILAAATLLLIGGCGDDNTELVVPDDSSGDVEASLIVQVLAWPSEEPVAGARWEVVQEGVEGTTDETGYFTISSLALGSHQIKVSAPRYYSTRYDVLVDPMAEKQKWQLQGSVYLPEQAASFELLVVDRAAGLPIAGAPVSVSGYAYPGDRSDLTLDATDLDVAASTDTLGMAHLTGLPSGRVSLRAGGFDGDADGFPDYAVRSAEIETSGDYVGEATLVLNRPGETASAFELVSTNLPERDRGVTAESLYFIFNVPMYTEQSALNVVLKQYRSPHTEVPLLRRWTSPLRLEIEPAGGLLGNGVLYQLDLWATSGSGLVYNVSRRFYWLQPETVDGDCESTVESMELISDDEIDYGTSLLEIAWPPTICDRGYDIYLRDDRDNPEWVYYGHEDSDFGTGLVEHTVALPSIFDRFRSDSRQTPFAGTQVSLCVVPTGSIESEPGPNHATLVLADIVPPSLGAAYVVGPITNSTDRADVANVTVQFSEYLDPATPAPTLEFREAGGDPDYCPDASGAVWRWDAGMHSGYFEFVIPAGANGSSDEFRVQIDEMTDLSGNDAGGPMDTGWNVSLPTGGDWDFEEDEGGWTTDNATWQWGAPTDGPASGYLSSRCWATGLDSYYSNGIDVELVSPLIIAPGSNPHIEFYASDDFSPTDFWEVLIESNGVARALNHVTNDADTWRLVGFALDEYAGQPIRIIFRFNSDWNYNDSGLFIDDVRVFSRE